MGVGACATMAGAEPWLEVEGKEGPGSGKRMVLLAGDEEYRSEETMPMLANLLAERHGFSARVVFPVDPKTGEIDPAEARHLPGLDALEDADLVIMAWRFRELAEEDMAKFVSYVESGRPLIALRTSTHAFRYPKDSASPFAEWSWDSQDGGFGKRVLGETWVNPHGRHGVEGTRGVIEVGREDHPLLRGVADVWGPTDVYGIRQLPEDAVVLMRGEVLDGMTPDARPMAAKNEPMMPVAWVREREANGRKQRVVVTTMGAASDFVHPGLRRFVVNAAYWTTGLEVPAELDVRTVRPFMPTKFGFGGHRKGVKPGGDAESK